MYSLGNLSALLLLFQALRLVSGNPSLAQPESASIDQKIQVAERFFHSPGAIWVETDQPFWTRHSVLKLKANPDHRLTHRPSVAVDEWGKATMLSDGCFRVPQQTIVNGLNRITVAEAVQIDRENIVAYAQFIVAVHLASSDSLLPVPKEAVNEILAKPLIFEGTKKFVRSIVDESEIAVEVHGPAENAHADGFDVIAYLWNWKGGWIVEHRFTIRRNGMIELGSTQYKKQTNPSGRRTLPDRRIQLSVRLAVRS
jgi:hypothetical protein